MSFDVYHLLSVGAAFLAGGCIGFLYGLAMRKDKQQ